MIRPEIKVLDCLPPKAYSLKPLSNAASHYVLPSFFLSLQTGKPRHGAARQLAQVHIQLINTKLRTRSQVSPATPGTIFTSMVSGHPSCPNHPVKKKTNPNPEAKERSLT